MLRKALFKPAAAAATATVMATSSATPTATLLSSSTPPTTAMVTMMSHYPSSSSPSAMLTFRPTQTRLMMQGRNVQNQWTQDTMSYAGRRSDYDFDKEKWAKQMQFASFDCIMEPSITAPKYTSWEGIKKNIRRYMNMKKLVERRPGYKSDDLKELFVRYKYLTQSRDNADSALLLRITTHTEASRIEKEIAKRSNDEFKTKSWGAMRLNMKKGSGAAAAASTTSATPNNKSTTTTNNNSDSLVAAANNANDAVLLIKKPSYYDMHVTDFQLVTSYQAQMASEDWLQLTFKCEYYEKNLSDGEAPLEANTTNTSSAEGEDGADGEKKASTTSGGGAEFEKALVDKGYTKVLEYPCFELRMSDGVAGGVQYPFIVLGVMRRDGTRYGRDAQDAAALRKQFDRNRSWFS